MAEILSAYGKVYLALSLCVSHVFLSCVFFTIKAKLYVTCGAGIAYL